VALLGYKKKSQELVANLGGKMKNAVATMAIQCPPPKTKI
jgi:hypothetical protein